MLLPLALGSAGVLAYTYVGYPALIGLLARFRPGRAAGDNRDYVPTVTACLPVYNAETFLREKLTSLLEQTYPDDRFDVLVFSDGSSDASDAIVSEFAARTNRVRLIRSDERVGKPTALNAMRKQAKGEVLLMTDARQPLSRNALRDLVQKLGNDSVGCVSGNLVMRGAKGAGAYWKYEKWIRMREAIAGSMVGATGAIYVIRKKDLPELRSDLILDDMWIPLRLRVEEQKRIIFCEEAKAFDQAFDDEREFGRKVRTLAGNYQLFAWIPKLLSPVSNPSWFALISHKLLRLVCPFFLVLLFVSTGLLAFGEADENIRLLSRAALGLQVVFYAAAALGSRLGKLGGVARTFVVMNAAAVVGLFRFLRGTQKITW